MLAPVMMFVVQLLVVAVLLFGDIGFDRPGRFGLDFGHFLILCVLYVVALVSGVVLCLVRKHWKLLATQAIVPIVVVCWEFRPPSTPRLEASEYQHLVGKSKAEALEVLKRDRMGPSGSVSDSKGERDFISYKGMTIYFSREGRVLSVEANRD